MQPHSDPYTIGTVAVSIPNIGYISNLGRWVGALRKRPVIPSEDILVQFVISSEEACRHRIAVDCYAIYIPP